MNQPTPTPPPPRAQLTVLRIIWMALLLGPLVFFGVIVSGVMAPPQTTPQPVLVWVNLVMLLTFVPVAFVVRTVLFRRAEVEGGIPIAAYSNGSIIFWAGCEGVSFLGLVIAHLNGSLWPTIVISGIAMGLQVLTFPVGGRLYVPPGQSPFRT
jgi:hypothetical protein